MPSLRNSVLALLAVSSLAAASGKDAGAAIRVDSAVFDGGVKIMNKDTLVKAEFRYYNTGSEPLRVSNVRVSCGCTVVSYDTVVQPGKSGVLKPVVNLKGFRSGTMSRTVTIMSNAANTPSLTLTISATIVAPVEVSAQTVFSGHADKETVYLTSSKKDLKVSGVLYKPEAPPPGGGPQWTANVPLNINYKLTPTDSVGVNGAKVYRLELTNPGGGKEMAAGEVVITTNHPDMKEVKIRAGGHYH